MPTEENDVTPKVKSTTASIIIVQAICSIIILLTVLIVKFFFADTYTEIKNWYENNLCVDTDINEVLEIDGDSDEI